MKFTPTEIPEVILIEPDVYRDPRGFFLETFHAEKYREGGINVVFVQDNHSCSVKNTLRGLHAQLDRPQAKLLRVIAGEIFDVAVDIRRGSPTFGQWVGISLSAENHRQLYVPVGFAHGFCVTSERAEVEYKCTDFYHPAGEITVRWDDPRIGIEWPIEESPILSDKDRSARTLEEVMERLPEMHG